MSDREVFGTSDPESPVTRAELERALRHLNLGYLELRNAMLEVGARVISLTDELTRRLDGVEPLPASAGTPAAETTATIELAANEGMPNALLNMRAADESQGTRVALDLGDVDKYTVESPSPPCEELIPICKARCCRLSFSLSTQDLDEGVVRFDYGQPYLIKQRQSDGYCVHSDPTTRACGVHAQRPRVCRTFDCRDDDRIWADYEKRIPASTVEGMFNGASRGNPELVPATNLLELVKRRQKVIETEKVSIASTFSDEKPATGPPPRPRKPLV